MTALCSGTLILILVSILFTIIQEEEKSSITFKDFHNELLDRAISNKARGCVVYGQYTMAKGCSYAQCIA